MAGIDWGGAGIADTYVWCTISVRSFLEMSISENVYTSFEGSCNFPTGLVLYIFAYWAILHAFMSSADFLSKSSFLKNSFVNTIRVSSSLDTD